jgi:hypothetical protein
LELAKFEHVTRALKQHEMTLSLCAMNDWFSLANYNDWRGWWELNKQVVSDAEEYIFSRSWGGGAGNIGGDEGETK